MIVIKVRQGRISIQFMFLELREIPDFSGKVARDKLIGKLPYREQLSYPIGRPHFFFTKAVHISINHNQDLHHIFFYPKMESERTFQNRTKQWHPQLETFLKTNPNYIIIFTWRWCHRFHRRNWMFWEPVAPGRGFSISGLYLSFVVLGHWRIFEIKLVRLGLPTYVRVALCLSYWMRFTYRSKWRIIRLS